MSNSAVIPIKSLDSKNIIITKLRFDKNKKPSAIYLNVDGKKGSSFIFETCVMTVAFAANYFGENNKEKIVPEEQRNYSIVFRPNGGNMDVPEDSARFMAFLEDLKNMSIDFGIENSNQNILKKKFDQSQREIMMETSYSYPFKPRSQPDGTFYPTTVSVKVPRNKDTMQPELLCVKNHLGKIENVEISTWEDLKIIAAAGTKCKAMIQPILSFVNKQLCFTLRIKQLQVFTYDKITIPTTYAFSDVPIGIIDNGKEKESSNADEDEHVVTVDSEEHVVESDVEVDVDDN
jgi:hypothetical protein